MKRQQTLASFRNVGRELSRPTLRNMTRNLSNNFAGRASLWYYSRVTFTKWAQSAIKMDMITGYHTGQ
jgi:hypothetical protein